MEDFSLISVSLISFFEFSQNIKQQYQSCSLDMASSAGAGLGFWLMCKF